MTHKYLKNVVTLRMEEKRCTGCGMCADVCPHGVFAVDAKKARIISRDSCIECGACVKNCPFGALTVKSGVGCASAVINGFLKGTEPSCDCSGGGGCC